MRAFFIIFLMGFALNAESQVPPPDTLAPIVSISSFTPNPSLIVFRAIAHDNVRVSKVEFLLDSGVKSTLTAPPFSYVIYATATASGQHSVQAKAYDKAGNVGTSKSLSFTFLPPPDTLAPIVSITSPTDGATVSGTIAITATASDNVSVSKVEFHVDNILKNTDSASPYSFTLDSTLLSNGSHTILATAYDAAGNNVQHSISVNANNGTGENVTPVYLTICSHNETDSRYDAYNTLSGYLGLRENILKIAQLVKNHNAKWDFQPDWRFLEAALVYETQSGVTDNTNGKNILRYISEDLGVQVDPHSHESDGYNYADVAYLISQLGVEPTGIVGGFLWYPQETAIWEKFRSPLTGAKYPGYTWQAEALWGGGTFQHAGPDDASFGVWRPKDKYNFTVDDPASNLPNIGNGGGRILELIQLLESGKAPSGKLYTATYMVFELSADLDYNKWDRDLTTLDQYVATGQVVYATLSEVLALWRTQYNSEPFRYELPSTIPTCEITNPANGSAVSGTISITANASDDAGVSKVELLYVDEMLKATDETSPYSFSLNTTELADGSHTIMAKAFDADGNSAEHSVAVAVSNAGNDPSSGDSPFGIHPANTYDIYPPDPKALPSGQGFNYETALDLGVKWNRPGFYALWDIIQKTDEDIENGNFNWTENDYVYNGIPESISTMGNIAGFGNRVKSGEESYPRKYSFKTDYYEEKYIYFVKKLVERYDGDGVDDMPNLKNPVKYWQIENEPDAASNDSAGYAHLLKISYQAIKESCSDCKVIMGGLSGGKRGMDEFFTPIINELNGDYVDVFDFHSFGPENGWEPYNILVDLIKKPFLDNGKSIEIWIAETGTTSGYAQTMPDGSSITQTEKQQANSLLKRFVYALSVGVKKVFWAWGLQEDGFGGEFNHTGLIYDGREENDLGYGVKKLSYYTYKLMVEKLEGSDWDNIETVRESDGVYVYKFTRSSCPVWVAWTDNESNAQVTISGVNVEGALITEAVPSYESGLEVTDYAAAFSTRTYAVSGGEVTITISSHSPVFVEPSSVLQEDTTPPTVSITSPADGSTVSGSVTISATASDNIGVSKVELYVDETLKATDGGTSPYSFSLNTTELSDGSHTIMAKAFDAAGNIGVSQTLKIIIEGTQSEAVTVYPDDNTIIVANSYRTSARIKIQEQTFTKTLTVSANIPDSFPKSASSNDKLIPTGIGVEINLSESSYFYKEVIMEINYSEEAVSGFDESRLIVARYDETAKNWIPLESIVYPGQNMIIGKTSHFSLFQVMQQEPGINLMNVRIYPNPLYPNRGHEKVVFDTLPMGAKIKIFTLESELVWEGETNSSGMAFWYGKNKSNKKVASGVYIVYFEYQKETKILKLSVIK